MPYVSRDGGKVTAIFAQEQDFASEWLDGEDPEIVAFRIPAPTASDVIAERERRLALGFDHDFGGERGVHHFATTAEDMRGWDEVTKLAAAAIAAGLAATEIQILTSTGAATVTATEWQAVLLTSAAARQPIWQASFVLQAMDPIPAGFADDSYWGATS